MFCGACFCVCRCISVWSALHVSIGVCGGQGTTLGVILRNAVYLLCGNISPAPRIHQLGWLLSPMGFYSLCLPSMGA